MTVYGYAAWGYLALISLVSVIVCAADKRRSKIDGARRVPEITLLALCAFGGSAAMFVTMLLIRHKTNHAKFMIGIPAIIIAQYAVAYLAVNFFTGRLGW